jgi:hypothetical protein
MSRVIPNENSWIGFTDTEPVDVSSPTVAELAAAVNLTPFTVSLNPTSQGNAVPTPALDSLFDRSVIGTSQGAFSGDFYRDDDEDDGDIAWDTLPRGKHGWFFVSRFGGSGADHMPVAGEAVEVWDVAVTQRAGSAMTSNTVQTFTITGAVNEPPEEDAVVSGVAGNPSAPENLIATPGATGTVNLDWDAPDVGGPITAYKVYRSATPGGTYVEVTTGITKTATSANLTGQTAGANSYKVTATNATGEGPRSDVATCTVA